VIVARLIIPTAELARMSRQLRVQTLRLMARRQMPKHGMSRRLGSVAALIRATTQGTARFTAGRFFRALHFDFCRRDCALCAATGVGPQCAG
jgi:hypothetical protein